MGRLIDADELQGVLSRLSYFNADDMQELVKQQPTAYDVEKVAEQLEEELKVTRREQTIECIGNNGHGTPLQAKYSGEICALLKAIQIVRNGGIQE